MTADDPRPAGEACTCTELQRATVCHDMRTEPHLVGCPRWGTLARPAAPGGATDGEPWGVTSDPVIEAQFQRDIAEINAAEGRCTVASQADGGLRAKAEQLWHDLINEDDQGAVDKLIPLLADAAKVQRVREIADEMTAQADARGGKRYRPARTLWHFADRIRRALDSDR